MPLKISIKPGEKVLIGKTLVSNGGERTAKLLIHNKTPVVQEKDVVLLDEAQTFWERLYAVVLQMYVDQENERQWHGPFFGLLREGLRLYPQGRGALLTVSEHLMSGDFYPALRILRDILRAEREDRAAAEAPPRPEATAEGEDAR